MQPNIQPKQSTIDDPQAGKVAEDSNLEKGRFPHILKVSDKPADSACLVEPITHHHLPTQSTNQPSPKTPLQTLISTPKIQTLISQARSQRTKENSRRENLAARKALPTAKWKSASQDEKFRYSGHATQASNGIAFSLNLSDTLQSRLKSHTNPLRAFTDILNRELKKQNLSGIPYALSLEDSAKDKLHVHGFLLPPSKDTSALKLALRAAGGPMSAQVRSRQLTLKSLSDGAGWAFYCAKDQKRTSSNLNGTARLFINRSMTQIAREFSA